MTSLALHLHSRHHTWSAALSCQCSRRSAARTPPGSRRGTAETPCACAATWRAGTCRDSLSQKPPLGLSSKRGLLTRQSLHSSQPPCRKAASAPAEANAPPLSAREREESRRTRRRSRSSRDCGGAHGELVREDAARDHRPGLLQRHRKVHQRLRRLCTPPPRTQPLSPLPA